MLPSPAEIKYFLEASETLNFSRAAERLGITQPTLTQAIKRLEHNIGKELFIRSKSGVRLSAAGKKLRRSAEELTKKWGSLCDHILEESQTVQGRVSIGAHTAVSQYTLPLVLPKLIEENPGLSISLHHGLSRHVCEKIISYDIDLGIVVNPVKHPDLVIKEILKDNVTFWSSSRNKNKQTLIFDPELSQAQYLIKKSKLQFKNFIHSNNLEVVRSLVESGSGVGILPTRVASLSPKVKVLSEKSPSFNDSVCLVYRFDQEKTLKFKTVLQSIQREF